MKILLNFYFSAEINLIKANFYPFGLLSIAAYIHQYKPETEIKIIVGPLELTDINDFRPDLVGITLLTPYYTDGVNLIKRARKVYPDLPIVIGGHHITYLPECLPQGCIGIIGEGEVTFYELVGLLSGAHEPTPSGLESIDGLIFWSNGTLVKTGIRLNLQPVQIPTINNYHLCAFKFNLPFYYHMITSRGCLHRCRFCSSSSFWGIPRYYTATSVVDQLEYIVNTFFPDTIMIYDDLMISNLDHVKSIRNEIIKRKIKTTSKLGCWVAGPYFTEEIAQLLYDMNVRGVFFGVESGSPKIYRYLKGTWNSPDKNADASRLAKKYGFEINASILLGAPGETEDDLKMTLRYVKSNKFTRGKVFYLKIYPGTTLWKECVDQGLVNSSLEDWGRLETNNMLDSASLFLGHSITRKRSMKYFHKLNSLLARREFYYIWGIRYRKMLSIKAWKNLFSKNV